MATNGRPSFAALLKGYRLRPRPDSEGSAEAAGLSRDAINVLERGARRSPRHDTVAVLARALKLSGDERTPLLAAARPGESPTERDVASSPALPARLTSFVGRERRSPRSGVVGEKRLVTLRAGWDWHRASRSRRRQGAARFAGGVALVELADLCRCNEVPHAVAAWLGMRWAAGPFVLDTLMRASR